MSDQRHPHALRSDGSFFQAETLQGGAFSLVMGLFGTDSQVSAWACPQRGGLAFRFARWATCSISIKHADVLSDDGVVQRLAEGVYFQFFSCRAYFQPRHTCDSSLIRGDLVEPGVEELLKITIGCAVALQVLKKTNLQAGIVDSTGHWEAVGYPTDGQLLGV